MKKATINRVLLLLTACLVASLSCFIFTSLPKNAVAVSETGVAYSDYTLTATPAAGVTLTTDSAILSEQGVSSASFVAWNPNATKAKNWVNNVNRMTASVFNFVNPVDTSVYGQLVLNLDQTTTSAAIQFEFRFYRNEAGVVVGESEYTGSYVTTAIANGGKAILVIDLAPLADDNGMVSSFIILRYSDNRAQGNYPVNFALYDGYYVPNNSVAPKTGYTLVSTAEKAELAEGFSFATVVGYATSPLKAYVNQISRSKAIVIKFVKPIDTNVYYSIGIDSSKNIGAAVTYDFYPDLAGVKIGDPADSACTAEFTAATNARAIINLRLKDFADENGLVSSIIVVHTDDKRDGDYDNFGTSFYILPLTTKAAASADKTLEINGSDMIDGTSNAANNSKFWTVTGNKMYANDVYKGYAATIKFGTKIDVELFKTLLLNMNIVGPNTKYTYYVDLYKAGATDLTHGAATAKYSFFCSPGNSYNGTLVINLEDFADEEGLVESVTLVHYDNTGNNLQACNMQVFESYLMEEEFVSYEIEQYGRGYAMPEKTEENKVFVGWDIDGVLYAPFEIYKGEETKTATPVYIEFYMEAGASIRLSDPTGLRYSSFVSKESDAEIKDYVTVQYGTMFTSPNSAAKLEVLQSGSWIDTEDCYKFNGVMVNIAEEDYDRTFIGRSFAEITYASGEVTRVFAVGSHVERSVKGVAQAAIDAGDVTDPAQLAILNALAGNE